MRLFIMWSGMDLANGIVRHLKDAGHDVVYWVGSKTGHNNEFPEIIFHDHFDAWDGKPAPALALEEFGPPSCELIHRFHKTESIILTMMNKHFDWMGTDERKHLYYRMLSYWSGVLDKFKPEAVIFSTVPHALYDYILYELARDRKIKTIMFRGTLPVTGNLLLYEDFKDGDLSLRKKVEENKNRRFSPEDLSDKWREFYEKQTNPSTDTTPLYLRENKKRFSFLNRLLFKKQAFMWAIRSGEFAELASKRLIRTLKGNIRDEYRKVQSEPDFSKKFVYIPLHYQPESTTAPLGDVFVDQILMIKIVSSALHKDWVIYVKEHPTQWFKRGLNFAGSRYRGYYKEISKIKNVRIVPVETDTYFLMRHSKAVATISGVPGSEALLRRKPVLLFGYPWYRDCPGIFKVDSVGTCRTAIDKIENGFSVNSQDILNFLKSVDEAAIRGYIDDYQQKTSDVSAEEALQNITHAIERTLKHAI